MGWILRIAWAATSDFSWSVLVLVLELAASLDITGSGLVGRYGNFDIRKRHPPLLSTVINKVLCVKISKVLYRE